MLQQVHVLLADEGEEAEARNKGPLLSGVFELEIPRLNQFDTLEFATGDTADKTIPDGFGERCAVDRCAAQSGSQVLSVEWL
jgi:hypothetical protein